MWKKLFGIFDVNLEGGSMVFLKRWPQLALHLLRMVQALLPLNLHRVLVETYDKYRDNYNSCSSEWLKNMFWGDVSYPPSEICFFAFGAGLALWSLNASKLRFPSATEDA